ncbi:phenylalanine--tRNA ligase subunit beta [Ketogulonicigenium vulgare]|uniref:Phenylalanine--tRNA ligase beta subunit n=1 Tax=Ketogulonicigenium vulgare (strain WSH-001) TaxID=759362 RepID=F9Y8A8_KETVW|nr:phenylalanine--tRNA ligase subunit beta [Ketogulonicigenium vulgare]ADO41394.1 phenylalanyl-tRNA synthetase, beta subunit [Ketogulonicigenium vulgare Y25]AEM42394.1 Phenylalanyl-tRNA synthetase, beta subunit [Ketogulonicigenium vulgare WSH-001]ALJ80016.1 phenylalanine--tRNA ligase subunit beta [Ketogulonicigenium vulgare]ANW32899.1 phenylalanine--tRNA ligase subunit beta [Ketogulonicigenium vulgare]AOZ53478.1 phenylalanyl-tRNA synthetase, beta subunit [Ketogulonicigenium vulgare]
MKFTLSWLKDHLDTTASVEEITEALTDLGLEVEGVEDKTARLRGFKIGKVLNAVQHPDADKLRVCTVLTADGEQQIVCGAPNARTGITVVVASPGTYVPGIDVTIQVGKIRGVESHGMMCSERELELSDEHDGIIELPSGEVGQEFVDWLAENQPAKVDPVIEIAITPNRPDALAVRGVARDLAARGLGTLRARDVQAIAPSFATDATIAIAADTLDDAPVFAGQVLRGVKNGPSPVWLQDRLRAIGLRPISFLVDVTNFFSYDLCRPLHVFDLDKVKGTVQVRRARAGEELLALDGKTYALAEGQVIVADDEGPISVGGIMGGERTGVSDETVNVLVESAWWQPIQIAMTGRALKINSDARYRFERGVDPAFTLPGLDQAVRMIADIAGGEASQVIVAGAVPDVARAYRLDTDRVQSLVGMEIAPETQRATLQALGFVLDGDMASVPSWRPDVLGEADLVEEVARIASLTKLVGVPMPRMQAGVPKPILTPLQRRLGTARRTVASLGYNECVTYSFIDQKSASLFGGGDDASMLENPISADLSHLRPDLLPGLLRAAARNQARGFADLALFEAGHVFSGGEPGDQVLHVTGLLVGRTAPRDVHKAARAVDLFDAKADIEAVLAAVGAPARVQIMRNGADWWHPGRHGTICLGPKKVIGTFGELHPRLLKEMDIQGPAVAFTIFLEEVPLPKSTNAARPALVLNDLQPISRDFAFVVPNAVEALTMINAALGADKAMIVDARVFDEFAGGNLPEGHKSLALSVRIQPQGATLKEAEIEALSAKVVEKVAKATGAVLRG